MLRRAHRFALDSTARELFGRHLLDRRLHHALALPAAFRISARVVGGSGRDAFVVRPFVAGLNTNLVVDVLDASAGIGDVLDAVPDAAVLDVAAQRDLSILHLDRHVAGVDVVRVPQPLADVFQDAFVRTRVVLWATAVITAGASVAGARTVALHVAPILVTISAIVGFGIACCSVVIGIILRALIAVELLVIIGLRVAPSDLTDPVITAFPRVSFAIPCHGRSLRVLKAKLHASDMPPTRCGQMRAIARAGAVRVCENIPERETFSERAGVNTRCASVQRARFSAWPGRNPAAILPKLPPASR